MSAAWRKAWYVRWKKRKTRIRECVRCAEKNMTEFLHFPERIMKHLSAPECGTREAIDAALSVPEFSAGMTEQEKEEYKENVIKKIHENI